MSVCGRLSLSLSVSQSLITVSAARCGGTRASPWGEKEIKHFNYTEGAWVPLAAGAHHVSKAGETGMKVLLHARKPTFACKRTHTRQANVQ